MNAYAKEDPIARLPRRRATSTPSTEFLGGEGYSFVFQGQSGYLDHALASPSLAEQVAGVTEWHINADEPDRPGLQRGVQVRRTRSSTLYSDDAVPVLRPRPCARRYEPERL